MDDVVLAREVLEELQKAVDILSKVSNVHFRQKGNVIEITENRPQY